MDLSRKILNRLSSNPVKYCIVLVVFILAALLQKNASNRNRDGLTGAANVGKAVGPWERARSSSSSSGELERENVDLINRLTSEISPSTQMEIDRLELKAERQRLKTLKQNPGNRPAWRLCRLGLAGIATPDFWNGFDAEERNRLEQVAVEMKQEYDLIQELKLNEKNEPRR